MDTTTSRNYLNGGTLATPATVEYGTRDSRFQYRESPRTVDRSDGVYPHRRQGASARFTGSISTERLCSYLMSNAMTALCRQRAIRRYRSSGSSTRISSLARYST